MTIPPPPIRENVLLAPLTTIGLGGPARFFAVCSTDREIAGALAHARSRGIRVHCLGGGSNTLFSDRGFDGLVLRIGTTGLTFAPAGERTLVTAAAGEEWDLFVQKCVERGLGGVECLSGIPGLIGATPIQNVGAYGEEVGEVIRSVAAIDRKTLQPVTFSGHECGFGYRMSRFKEEPDRFVITGVTYALSANARPELRYPELQKAVAAAADLALLPAGAPALTAVRETVLRIRRGKSMVLDSADSHSRSLGSFFMNPLLSPEEVGAVTKRWEESGGRGPVPTFPAGAKIKIPAAWLVEQAGFPRGTRRGSPPGRVGVSERHALALVNYGGTTDELLALAREIEAAVLSRFGITLRREPVVVG